MKLQIILLVLYANNIWHNWQEKMYCLNLFHNDLYILSVHLCSILYQFTKAPHMFPYGLILRFLAQLKIVRAIFFLLYTSLREALV